MRPEVTVVILNWNGKNWLEKFLPSVLASTYTNMEVLLVDNGSTDDSVPFVKEKYPSVRLVSFDRNYGFAEGNNLALPHIETPYFVLLNSDVEVSPGWLEPLVECMESDESIASVQPKVKAYKDKVKFEYAGAAGGMIDRFGYPFCRGRLFDNVEMDMGQYDKRVNIFWATGACCLIRKSVVDQIGLFQAEFFAHMEEIDFCWRAKNFGYKVICEPASVVYHVGGGALPQGNPRKTYLNVRNSLACLYLNLHPHQVFFKIFARLALDGVWGIKSLITGDFNTLLAILKAHFAFYGQFAFWVMKKREIYEKVKPQKKLSGFFPVSIVWQYFIKRRKTFLQILQS